MLKQQIYEYTGETGARDVGRKMLRQYYVKL